MDGFTDIGCFPCSRWTFSPLTKEAMMRVRVLVSGISLVLVKPGAFLSSVVMHVYFQALWIAIATYRNDKEAWLRIMKRGMSQDFSWEKAALQYEQVFEWAMIDPPYA